MFLLTYYDAKRSGCVSLALKHPRIEGRPTQTYTQHEHTKISIVSNAACTNTSIVIHTKSILKFHKTWGTAQNATSISDSIHNLPCFLLLKRMFQSGVKTTTTPGVPIVNDSQYISWSLRPDLELLRVRTVYRPPFVKTLTPIQGKTVQTWPTPGTRLLSRFST